MKHRTPAYWPTRILLAVGCIATIVAAGLTLMTLLPYEGPLFDPPPDVLGLPRRTALALGGLVPVLVGFAWMLRIFRGPREEPPPWRYRDR